MVAAFAVSVAAAKGVALGRVGDALCLASLTNGKSAKTTKYFRNSNFSSIPISAPRLVLGSCEPYKAGRRASTKEQRTGKRAGRAITEEASDIKRSLDLS